MKFKAIIFDLDGTLLDTLDDLADAGNTVLAQAGLPVHSTDSYRYFVGDGLISLIQRILPEDMRSTDEVQRMALAFRDTYKKNWNAKTKPYAGIAEMLAVLKQRELPLKQPIVTFKFVLELVQPMRIVKTFTVMISGMCMKLLVTLIHQGIWD